MIKNEFTEEDIQVLNYERYHHLHPHVQRKMEALWLKSQELTHKDICRLTVISPNALRNYLRDCTRRGIETLKVLNFYQPKSELNQHKPYFPQF